MKFSRHRSPFPPVTSTGAGAHLILVGGYCRKSCPNWEIFGNFYTLVPLLVTKPWPLASGQFLQIPEITCEFEIAGLPRLFLQRRNHLWDALTGQSKKGNSVYLAVLSLVKVKPINVLVNWMASVKGALPSPFSFVSRGFWRLLICNSAPSDSVANHSSSFKQASI